MLKIKKSGEFEYSFKNLAKQDKEIIKIADLRTTWFKRNPQDTRLENHALTGKMKGKWAFSITDDIRIVYKWTGKNTVRLLDIGGHKHVYRK